ncbi:MAG: hypothetical protein FJW23_16930 [Acidimicrobiia bacterium]|nr:hypothetical protein [Acidimicrobiia bacterium]
MEPGSAERYELTLRRAGEFLRGRQRPDGSVAGADTIWGYYSQPLAFLGTGSPADWRSANRCLDHVRDAFLDADGSLRIEPLPLVGDLYPYPYLVRGASIWGRFDVAVPLTRTLLRYQDDCGGFRYRRADPRLMDPAVTPHGGIALLATGHVAEAERAGRLLVRLHEAQPDPANRYLTVWDAAADAPLADYTGVEDVPWGRGSLLVRDNPAGENAYWDIGFMMAFLCALSRTTGDPHYVHVARDLFDVFRGYRGFGEHVWKTPWGTAALYQATGARDVRDAALSMADEIVATQQADGGFFLGAQSSYVDAANEGWSYGFADYDELRANVLILLDTAAQMAHYLAQVRAVL